MSEEQQIDTLVQEEAVEIEKRKTINVSGEEVSVTFHKLMLKHGCVTPTDWRKMRRKQINKRNDKPLPPKPKKSNAHPTQR